MDSLDTRLQLLARNDGESVINDIAVAPYSPNLSETQHLEAKGFFPLDTDLGDVGLASGLRIFVKRTDYKRPSKQLAMKGDIERLS